MWLWCWQSINSSFHPRKRNVLFLSAEISQSHSRVVTVTSFSSESRRQAGSQQVVCSRQSRPRGGSIKGKQGSYCTVSGEKHSGASHASWAVSTDASPAVITGHFLQCSFSKGEKDEMKPAVIKQTSVLLSNTFFFFLILTREALFAVHVVSFSIKVKTICAQWWIYLCLACPLWALCAGYSIYANKRQVDMMWTKVCGHLKSKLCCKKSLHSSGLTRKILERGCSQVWPLMLGD